MWVILYCKGEDEVLKAVCFNGRYDQAEDYIEDESNMPEGTTRALIIPEKIISLTVMSGYEEKTRPLNGHG